MNQKIRSYVIVIFSFLLLFFVFREVGINELIKTLSHANLYWIFISFSLEPFLLLVSVIKWQILLKSQGIEVSLPRLYALYMIGRFFSNFLPSTVGGDVVRGYELGIYIKNYAGAMASVFVERLTGFIVLIGLALVSLFFELRQIEDIRISLIMVLAVVGLIIILWLVLDSRPLLLIDRKLRFPLARKYIPKLKKFHTSLTAYRSHKGTLSLALVWSLVFLFLAILNVYTSALSFHAPIHFVEIAVIVPVILVVAMMPFTFNGLGLQEWAYVVFFTWIGLPASVGLSTIILIRAKTILVAILGGILYPIIKLSKNGIYIPEEVERPDHIR